MRHSSTERASVRTAVNPGGPGVGENAILWIVPLILSLLGIIIISSASSQLSLDHHGTFASIALRQGVWLSIAMAGMVLVYAVPLTTWRRFTDLFWVFSLGLLALTFIPGIGRSAGGASRWINLGIISFQASDVLFFSVTLKIASVLERCHGLPDSRCFRKVVLISAISVFLLLFQPDMGSSVLIFALSFGMYVAVRGWRLPLASATVLLTLGTPFIFLHGYRAKRVAAWLDPFADPRGSGYQILQGLIAFANGGVGGMGLGNGLQKLRYLPAAHTDFVFAAVGEELGFIGCASILFLLAVWALFIRRIHRELPVDSWVASVLWGTFLVVFLQASINLCGVMKIIPMKGMPLPFLTYGGSALVLNWARVGLLLRLSREA
jgi:cell division protein FtsW